MADLRFIDRNVAADSFQADQDRRRKQERQDTAQQDEYERTALTALGSGDMTTFDHFSKKAGLQLPPEAVQDANNRRLLSAGALTATKFYDDKDQAAKFTQAYIQSNGDVNQSFTAAGTPRRRPNVQLIHVQHGNQQVLAMFDKNAPSGQSPISIPKDPGTGQPYQAAVDPSRDTTPALVKTAQHIQSVFKNPDGTPISPQAAWNIATMAKTNPQKLFHDLYNIHLKAALETAYTAEAQQAATKEALSRAQRDMQTITSQYGMGAYVGGTGGAGTSGAPNPQTNQPVSRYDPSTGRLNPYQQ